MNYLLLKTIDRFFKWLQKWLASEQSAISHYFDHHPSIRLSFLEAVQRVAGRGSLITSVATPAKSALDNEPVVSDSKEYTNRTDSITYDDVEDNQSSLRTPSAISNHIEAVTLNPGKTADEPYFVSPVLIPKFDVVESSFQNSLAQVETIPREQAKQKRPAPYISVHQGQRAGETDTLSTLSREILGQDCWPGSSCSIVALSLGKARVTFKYETGKHTRDL